MSLVEYHQSIGNEINDLKNRFRHLVGDQFHRFSDGKYKESILQTVLLRHLPKEIGAKTGFIRFDDSKTSSEIDILLYLNDRPMLFENGNLIVTTPAVVTGGIEVKTKIENGHLKEVFNKLADNAEFTRAGLKMESWSRLSDLETLLVENNPWFSVFSFESNANDESILSALDDAASKKIDRTINCLCLGPNKFVRFWNNQKESTGNSYFTGWRIYALEGLSFSYFLSNMIWRDAGNSSEISPWFPLESKEVRKIAERAMTLR